MPIPLILASKSKPRRDVLYSAGICPTIRVSHVDEPAALEAAAREEGVTVDDLSNQAARDDSGRGQGRGRSSCVS